MLLCNRLPAPPASCRLLESHDGATRAASLPGRGPLAGHPSLGSRVFPQWAAQAVSVQMSSRFALTSEDGESACVLQAPEMSFMTLRTSGQVFGFPHRTGFWFPLSDLWFLFC